MADLIILSTSSAAMPDYPFMIQAVAPDAAIQFTAEDTRQPIAANFQEGVCGMADFRVTQRAAGANLTVDIAPGRGVVQGDTSSRQGKFVIDSTATVNTGTAGNITVPGSGTRTHRVIARVRDKQASGTVYGWSFEVLEDTGSGMPALPASAMDIASIAVPSGSSSVTDAMITDRRSYACPQIPLAVVNLAVDTATYTFSGIPGFCRGLVLDWSTRCTGVGGSFALGLRINGDTGSNYARLIRRMVGNGTATPGHTVSADVANYMWAGVIPGTVTSAGIFAEGTVRIPKWRIDGNSTRIRANFVGSFWESISNASEDNGSNWWTGTAAPSSLTVVPLAGSLLAGTQLILTAIA